MIYKNRKIIAILIISLIQSLIIFNWSMDDGLITQRVSYNLYQYGTFAFNPGENNSFVITNLLWSLILYFLNFITSDTVFAEKILIIFISQIVIYCTYRVSKILIKKSNYYYLPALMLALSWNFAFWSIGGLETMLYTLLVLLFTSYFSLGIAYNKIKSIYTSLFIAIPLVYTRPDGLLFLGIALIILLFSKLEQKKRMMFYMLSIILIYFGSLYYIFGDIFPASYYFKVAQRSTFSLIHSGFNYLIEYFFLYKGPIFFLASIILPIVYLYNRRKDFSLNDKVTFFLLLFMLSYMTIFIIREGGDWMLGFRFIVHILPVSLIITFYVLSNIQIIRYIKMIILICFIFSSLLFEVTRYPIFLTYKENNKSIIPLTYDLWFSKFQLKPKYDDAYDKIVNYIKEKKYDNILLTEAGYIPYYCPGKKFIDLHGLVNMKYAKLHSKVSKIQYCKEIMKENIDLIILAGYETTSGIKTRLSNEQFVLDYINRRKQYKLIKVYKNVKDIYRYSPKDGISMNYYLFAKTRSQF